MNIKRYMVYMVYNFTQSILTPNICSFFYACLFTHQIYVYYKNKFLWHFPISFFFFFIFIHLSWNFFILRLGFFPTSSSIISIMTFCLEMFSSSSFYAVTVVNIYHKYTELSIKQQSPFNKSLRDIN